MARFSETDRNFVLTILGNQINSGFIRLYDGVRPADTDTPLGANVLIAELAFAGFDAATSGLRIANPIAPVNTVAGGIPSFARIFKSDGVTSAYDASAGVSGTEILLPKEAWVLGELLTISAFTLSFPVGD